MKVSVIIRAFNEEAHLGKLLFGLRRQTHLPHEIIVVDSGSTDRTVEIAVAAGCKIVEIRKEEFTFGRSLNFGCAAATGDLLLLVSAHVYPENDTFIANLVGPFAEGDAAMAYGRQVGDHRTQFSEHRIMRKWFPEESTVRQSHPFCNNANAMIKRSVWAKYRYNESLTGLEDIEIAKRILEDGLRLDYVASAPVVHVHEESWSTVRNRYEREAIAHRQIIHDQRFPMWSALGLGIANTISDYAHAIGSGQLSGNVAGIPKFRSAQFIGAARGFRTSTVDQRLMRRLYYPPNISTPPPRDLHGSRIDYSVATEDPS